MAGPSETGGTGEVTEAGARGSPPLPPLPELSGRRQSNTPGGVPLRVAASCAAGVLLLAAAQAAYLYGPADLHNRILLLMSVRLPWAPVALYALLLLVLLPGALASGFAGLAAKTPEGVRAALWALAAALGAAWVVCTS